MSSSDLQKEWAAAYLSGGSMAYVDSLYEDYLADPRSVSSEWQSVFSALPQVDGIAHDMPHREIRAYFLEQGQKARSSVVLGTEESKQANVTNLINAYRAHGHHASKLDPLEMSARIPTPSLDLSYHRLQDSDLDTSFHVDNTLSTTSMKLRDIYQALRETYCGSIGIEYMHISDTEETAWLQSQLETVRGRLSFSKEQKRELLKELIAADGLERYLATKYVGQKRFSLEGGDALIPMMKEIIRKSAEKNVHEVVVGMAHRGRLNVLINVLGKDPKDLFQEFEGKVNLDRTGDVKYHMGYSSNIATDSGHTVHVALAFNPSHLEIISPVVEGSARSRLTRRGDLSQKSQVLPVLIHGDAAFAGQGVVMETFNFSQARGYCTGGSIHIVINNQIGFTTSNPIDSRSTLYCTDVAKMVQAPILHVNGDDPEAVVFATQIALDFRMKFKRDVVIDLVCYRRNGHNEADEPSVTQPMMYKKIKSMRPLREIYADTLLAQSLVTPTEVSEWNNAYRDGLDQGLAVVETVKGDFPGKMSTDWTPFLHAKWTEKADTTLSLDKIKAASKQLLTLPSGFTLNPVVKKLLEDREKMTAGELPLNWGYAETMAFASLLQEGYGVRLSGQDCGRGTFAHRHATLYDAQTGEVSIPLESFATSPAKMFTVIDSVLSEEAVLAFEYGYACSDPNTLVMWEAQFGDFVNGAQVVIDQFISSGEQKWGRLSGLVMLLPHGYEGQGPEHSSARLERFMQLCAQHNIQVCTPTTPAQIFHLLRRQMLRPYRKPLIVMTPKSLLRHKLAVSSLSDLTDGHFHTVIPEVDTLDAAQVRSVILCGGKVYYDLLQKRRDDQLTHVAIIRIEQLYPFPKKALMAELAKYPQALDVVWCQEEPKNQGAWFSSQHHMRECLSDKQTLRYAGRGFAASPAAGSTLLHNKEQQALVLQALLGESV